MASDISTEVRSSFWQWAGLVVGGAVATIILGFEVLFAFGYAFQQISDPAGAAVAGVIGIILGAIGPIGVIIIWLRSTGYAETTAGRIALTELFAGVAGLALFVLVITLWAFVFMTG